MGLLFLLPLINAHYYQVFQWQTIALYAACVTLIWIMITRSPRSPLTHQHRTTVLWFGSIISAIYFLTLLLLTPFAISSMHFFIISINAALFVIAAKRAQSSLPIYLALALGAVYLIYFRHHMALHGTTGLGAAFGAVFLLWMIYLLRKKQVWLNLAQSDLFFGNAFILKSKHFLTTPLIVTGWIMVVFSHVTLIKHFTPLAESPILILTLFLNGLFIYLLALTSQIKMIGALLLIPLALMITALLISLPIELRIPAGSLLLLGFMVLTHFIHKSTSRTQKVFYQTFMITSFGLAMLWIPISFSGYYLLLKSPPYMIFGYALFCLLFSHGYFVKQLNAQFSHLVMLHFMTIWILAILQHYGSTTFIMTSPLVYWLIGLSILTLIPDYCTQYFKHPTCRHYAQHWRAWLMIFVSGLSLFLFYTILIWQPPANITFLVAIILLQLTIREHYQRLFLWIKSGLCICLGMLMTQANDLVLNLIAGIVLISIIEGIFSYSEKWTKWQGVQWFSYKIPPHN